MQDQVLQPMVHRPCHDMQKVSRAAKERLGRASLKPPRHASSSRSSSAICRVEARVAGASASPSFLSGRASKRVGLRKSHFVCKHGLQLQT